MRCSSSSSREGPGTLASTAMMLRRAAMLNGDENWAQITEASCREAFWLSGRGLPYNFSYGEMTVGHDRLPGGQANEAVLIDLLEEHPEGIMLHAACVPHGILLTEYKDGQFYCADPSEYAEAGIIPIEEAGHPGGELQRLLVCDLPGGTAPGETGTPRPLGGGGGLRV